MAHGKLTSNIDDILDSVSMYSSVYGSCNSRPEPSAPLFMSNSGNSSNVHTPPRLTSHIKPLSPRNFDTAIMCGCKGHFFWEFIPVNNVSFFRGTLPDVVERCISSIHVYRDFQEAFWDAYTQCIEQATLNLPIFVSDFSVAIYQMHNSLTCPRHYARYTLGSFKSFMEFNEMLRESPIVGVFCRCKVPSTPLDIAYNLCFTCLQATLELKALSLAAVLQHFTYEVSFKTDFLNALTPGVRNNREYFLAQSLFDVKLSKIVKMGTGWVSTWNTRGVSWKGQKAISTNRSFCIMCNIAGNGFDLFVCKNCTKYKM